MSTAELEKLLKKSEMKNMTSEIKSFGEIQEGDHIVGSDGLPVEVVKVYEKHYPEKMYEIELENGEVVKVSGNHLWYIETNNHLSMFHSRVKNARKFLKKRLTEENVERLLEVANSDEMIETALIDMVAAIDSVNVPEGERIIARIASSLGKVSDNNEILKDYETGEIINENNVPFYDAKLFCQQILALYNNKYAKCWKIVKGEVVTTEDLLAYYSEVNLPTVRKK